MNRWWFTAILANAPGGTRTLDHGIGNQFGSDVTNEEPVICDSDPAAPTSRTTSGTENRGPIDPDLQRVIERWPDLAPAIRAGILAMVNAGVKP